MRQAQSLHAVLWTAIACIMAGCAAPTPRTNQTSEPSTQQQAPLAAVDTPRPAPALVKKPERISLAPGDKEYRQDAAKHLYTHNSKRIYPGKMPPLLYAIGVLEVDIDELGLVTDLRWMRAPSHAPEVVAEIERSIRAAAPFPAPSHTGKATYTDTWLWHKSGRFQLDTLTLGQL